MTRLEWGSKDPLYDLGLDRGVLYTSESVVPWNGLVSVDEAAVGEIDTDHYFEGRRLEITQVLGDFEGTISAYTYPDAFEDIRERFDLSYRTQIGAKTYRLHLIYGALVRGVAKSWATVTERPSLPLFAWDIYGEALPVPGSSPSSHLMMEISEDSPILDDVEDILYGTDSTDPRMPSPAEILSLFESLTILKIVYNGNGSYTATGPDEMVELLPDGQFRISSPSANPLDSGIFVVNSY